MRIRNEASASAEDSLSAPHGVTRIRVTVPRHRPDHNSVHGVPRMSWILFLKTRNNKNAMYADMNMRTPNNTTLSCPWYNDAYLEYVKGVSPSIQTPNQDPRLL